MGSLARLLAGERARCGTRTGRRALAPVAQAVLVLRWFLDASRVARLAADNTISTATAYRYLHEETPCSKPPSQRYGGSRCVPGGSALSPPPRSCYSTSNTTAQHDHRATENTSISSFNAASSTFLVNSFNSPSGPVNANPRARASVTIAAAAACSAVSSRPGPDSYSPGLTRSDVITHSAHPAGPPPGASGRKHRSWDKPSREATQRV